MKLGSSGWEPPKKLAGNEFIKFNDAARKPQKIGANRSKSWRDGIPNFLKLMFSHAFVRLIVKTGHNRTMFWFMGKGGTCSHLLPARIF